MEKFLKLQKSKRFIYLINPFCLIYFSFILFSSFCANAAIRYVKPIATGTGDGSSWANASSDLQTIIDASASNDEIWVAAGTYKPTAYPISCSGCSSARDYAFLLKNQTKLYGGFAGTETLLSQRTITANASILSGDIGTPTVTSDNVHHVIISLNDDNTTILDGFTITQANANESGSTTIETFDVARNQGGGMYAGYNANPLISNCNFITNISSFEGGAMLIQNSAPTITNCNYHGNNSNRGGAIFATHASTIFTNCNFSNNTATTAGGIYNWDGSSPIFINCGFSNNTADDGSGAMLNLDFFVWEQSKPTIKNCIFWGNRKGVAVSSIEGNTATVSYSDVEGGYAGTGNINQNPLFVNAADPDGPDDLFATIDDGLALQNTSPVINSGDPTITTPTKDITGFTRIGVFDMGAYEANLCIIYVNDDATGVNNGSNWTNAYTSLEVGLSAARTSNCSDIQIWVAAGTYKPSAYPVGVSSSNPRDFTFHLINGVKMYGGFAGTETLLSERTKDIIATNPSILSGDIGVIGDVSDNSIHVVVSISDDINTVLDGFTITKGNANINVDHLTVETINISKIQGGGFIGFYSFPTIMNCNFIDNRSDFEAGAFFNQHGSPTVTNCIFSMNNSNRGGAVFGTHASPSFSNCVFSNNTAETAGAVYNWDGSNTTFTNCTFANNSSNGGSGAMLSLDFFVWGPSNPTIKNCIFWGNKMNNLPSDIVGNEAYVSYSDIETGHTGIGNISQNPLFINAADTDGPDNKFATTDDGLSLMPCSPAINAGDNTLVPVGLLIDIIGENRIQINKVDLGAYESNTNITPAIATTNSNFIANQAETTIYLTVCNSLIAKVVSNGVSPIAGTTEAKVWIESSIIMYNNLPIVKRHYQITPSANTNTATGRITLYFTQQEFDEYNNNPATAYNLPSNPIDEMGKSVFRIIKFSGNSNNNTGLPNSYVSAPTEINPIDDDIIWNATENHWEVTFEVEGFSGFFVQGSAIALPLNLLTFSAKQNNQNAELKWKTSNEINTKRFEIEMSEDGNQFTKIGIVFSKNNTEEQEYNFIDKNIGKNLSSILYYRLKQIDIDETFTYSKIISLNIEKNNKISINPNPTIGNIVLNLGNKTELLNTKATITNSIGIVVKQFKINKTSEEINLSSLPKAVYLIMFEDGTILKLIKDS